MNTILSEQPGDRSEVNQPELKQAELNKPEVNKPEVKVLSLGRPAPARGFWIGALRRLFRNKAAVLGLVLIIFLILTAVFADWMAIRSYEKQSLKDNNSIPSWMPYVFTSMKPKGVPGGYAKVNDAYPFGTDYLGRDIYSRLVYGTRISLVVAFIGPLISLLIGVLLGSIAGYAGGWIDTVIMRIVDIMYAFPALLLIILMMAFFRSSLNTPEAGTFAYTLSRLDAAFGGLLFIFIGIGITSWENMARLTRGQVLAARNREYVVAAQAIGIRDRSILFRHVLPNVLGPLIVAETFAIPSYIATEAFLSYIGLGVNRPTPSWGSMIADGVQGISTYPNQAVFPALFLAVAMFAFNFLGDGLRDALDPRTTER